MNINKHSITFKTVIYLAMFSLLFVLFTAISINNIFTKTYKNLEKEKISMIQQNILPSLALNLSYEFDEAVEEVMKKTLENKNVLLIKLDIKQNKRTLIFTNAKKTIKQYIASHEFISTSKIIDPTSSNIIADVTIVYSKKAFQTYMKELYIWLFFGILGLILFIIMSIYFLIKSLRRLTTLATLLNNFNPKKPEKLNLDISSNDEVSSILLSANNMIDNLIKYINHSKELNTKLSYNQIHLKNAQRMAKIGSWEYDVVNNNLILSDELYRIMGIKKSKQLSWEDTISFIEEKEREYIISVFNNAIKNGSNFDVKHSIITKNKKSIYIHTRGKVRKKIDGSIKITAVTMDVTEDTKNKQIIENLAYYDTLTKLPNRTLLKDRIHKALQNASRENSQVAILFLDLDHFKLINDTLGHGIGDELLIYISKLLSKQIRASDTLSRLGGDEFVVLLPNIKSLDDATHVAKNLLDTLAGLHNIDSHQLYITTSIGISIYPDNATTMDELITNADIAMYDAKQDGRNRYKVYSKHMTSYISLQMEVEQDLKNAVNNGNELEIYYQPKVDIKGNFIAGAEALIRWNHPTKGLMFPDEFIEVAESTGIILELGRWIIQECISQVKIWNKAGFTKFKLAINLSARQFQDNDLVPFIHSMIKKYNVNPSQLEFEITETISMSNMETTLRILNELKNIGVSIAIDDFGTGYSSLSYLKKFPINTLKIDKSFIADMTIDKEDKAIVKTIISMAQTMGFTTVAEGVETKEHKELLSKLGCNQIQGYYYSKPISENAFTKFLLEYK